ncbi:MAG: sulfotransferase [Planctomycetota bacterium]
MTEGRPDEYRPSGVPRRKLLYILGDNRSGSTMLSAILNGVDGFASVGEMWYYWQRGCVENWLCSCGEAFRDCPFWSAVDRRVNEADRRRRLAEALSLFAARQTRGRDLVNRLVLWKHRRRRRQGERAAAARAFGAVFEVLFEFSGARVLVDSSKVPTMAALHELNEAYDTYFLHLLRDPRAKTYSEHYRKRVQVGDGRGAKEMGKALWLSVHRWNTLNRRGNAFAKTNRYLRLRYEQFVADPAGAVRRIVAFVDEDPQLVEQADGGFPVGDLHLFSGNPSRMASDVMTVRADMEWCEKYPPVAKAMVSLATWPLRRTYGYPWAVAQARGEEV